MPNDREMFPMSPLWRGRIQGAGLASDALHQAIFLDCAKAMRPANENARAIAASTPGTPPEAGDQSWRLSSCWIPSKAEHQCEVEFEIYQAAEVRLTSMLLGGGDWRWRLRMPPDQILASGKGYRTKRECERAVEWLRRYAAGAQIRHR